MRWLTCLALFLTATVASADSFVDAAGGIAIPMGNDNWKNVVDTSPKLELRAGALSGDVGGLLEADWTPANLVNKGGSNPFGSASASGMRFRILPNVFFHHTLVPKIALTARFGAGIDIAHYSYEGTLLGVSSSAAETDVGFAAEFGAGLWFRVGSGTELGVELAVPIGWHGKKNNADNINFDYTSYDLDLLFGLRLFGS